MPAIFSATGELLVPTAEGPYHWVSSLARDFTLVLGEARLRVRHSSVPAGVVDPLLPLPGAAGAAEVAARNTRDLTQSSFAAPVRGDVIEWRKEGRPVEQPVLFVKGSRECRIDLAWRAADPRLASHARPPLQQGGCQHASHAICPARRAWWTCRSHAPTARRWRPA